MGSKSFNPINLFMPPHAEQPRDPGIDPAEEERVAREAMIARRRRGLAGTVATSPLGVMGSPATGAKTLLGE
jgi:hypothetical protein